MTDIKAYAAVEAGGGLQPYEYDAGELAHNYVEIAVSACGLCHSDLSMINNDWRASRYPLIAGHEAVGTVTQIGANVKNLKVGQVVGVGWNSESCLHCSPCLVWESSALHDRRNHHTGGTADLRTVFACKTFGQYLCRRVWTPAPRGRSFAAASRFLRP